MPRWSSLFFLFVSFVLPNPLYSQTQPPPPAAISLPAPAAVGQPKSDLLFILDVSGSMNSVLGGDLMIGWAKKAIQGAVADLPAEAEVGLRVYAHRVEQENRAASCQDSELLVPIGAGTGSLVSYGVLGLKPKGWTPIAYSLEQAANDFVGKTERLHTIILVSDGEETCGGDPLAAARGLVAKGYRIKIFTIGFNVEKVAQEQLAALAKEFGGTYTDVRQGLTLEKELTQLTQQTFLIEKEKKGEENRIRGGDSMEKGVPIEFNKRYRLDHHQRKGEFDYFVFDLSPGQEVQLEVFPVNKCVVITGNQVEEGERGSCSQGRGSYFYGVLVDQGNRQLGSVSGNYLYHDIHSDWVSAKGEGPAPYYLVVGNDQGDFHRDHEFQVLVRGEAIQPKQPKQAVGDAGTGQDAGDSLKTAMPIQPGLYEANQLYGDDKTDLFKIKVPPRNALKVVVNVISADVADAVAGVELQVLGPMGEILRRSIAYPDRSAVENMNAIQSAEMRYLHLERARKDANLGYSLAIALTEIAAPPVAAPPPPPIEEPRPADGEVRSKMMTVVTLLAWVVLIAGSIFLVKKGTRETWILRIVGWFEIVASTHGILLTFLATLPFLSGSLPGKLFLVSPGLAIGVLGIVAGCFTLTRRSSRLSLWWGLLQLPWIELTLGKLKLGYACAFLLGLPYGLIYPARMGGIGFGGSPFPYGMLPRFDTLATWVGHGFRVELAVNSVAALFLMLLCWERLLRKKQFTKHP